MFSVKYKFPAWKDEEIKTVHFDGANISVAEMRACVADQTHCDPLDLVFKDHATDELFPDDGTIPRNSFVIVNRVVAKRTASGAPMRPPRRHAPNIPPPDGYVCDRCRGTGHFKANCPTLDNPAYDAGFATPAGIPTSMTIQASLESGTIRLANGTIASLKTQSETLDAVAEQRRLKEEAFASIPQHMRCSISRDLLRNPHIVPCCKTNFCARCILPDNLHDAITCPNCYKTVTGDKITANATLASEIANWKTETNFVDADPQSSESVAPATMVSAAGASATVKVERRKPPPRKGAKVEEIASPAAANTASPLPSSPSVDTATSNSTSLLPSSSAPTEVKASASPSSTDAGNGPEAGRPASSSPLRRESPVIRRDDRERREDRDSRDDHDRRGGSPPRRGSPPLHGSDDSSQSYKRDLSPKSRLKEIAAIRDAAKAKRSGASPSDSAPDRPISSSPYATRDDDRKQDSRRSDDSPKRLSSHDSPRGDAYADDKGRSREYSDERPSRRDDYDDRRNGNSSPRRNSPSPTRRDSSRYESDRRRDDRDSREYRDSRDYHDSRGSRDSRDNRRYDSSSSRGSHGRRDDDYRRNGGSRDDYDYERRDDRRGDGNYKKRGRDDSPPRGGSNGSKSHKYRDNGSVHDNRR